MNVSLNRDFDGLTEWTMQSKQDIAQIERVQVALIKRRQRLSAEEKQERADRLKKRRLDYWRG
jgi:hypothetical protein